MNCEICDHFMNTYDTTCMICLCETVDNALVRVYDDLKVIFYKKQSETIILFKNNILYRQHGINKSLFQRPDKLKSLLLLI